MRFSRDMTLFNTVLTVSSVVVLGVHYALGSGGSSFKAALDVPAFIAIWGYLAITPIAALAALAKGRRDSFILRRNSVLLALWILVLMLFALLPIL